jgi:hypothetical protein
MHDVSSAERDRTERDRPKRAPADQSPTERPSTDSSHGDDRDVPFGIRLPSLLQSSSRRRWRLGVVAVVTVAGASLVWPIYAQFGGIRPYVLGLPLSLAWVVGWLAVVFVTLGAFFLHEER